VALYTKLGVPASLAVLIPIVGFAAEMFVSSWGGLIFVLRRSGYKPTFVVDDADREELAHALIPEVPEAEWPKRLRGLVLGLGAGAIAGLIVGLAEGAAIVWSGGGRSGYGVLAYGATSYAVIFTLLGGGAGLALAWSGRLMKRARVEEAPAFARLTALLVAFFGLAIGAFRVRRDVFHEELAWKSPKGLLVFFACAAAAALVYFVISAGLEWKLRRAPGKLLLRPWGPPVVALGICAAAWGLAFAFKPAGPAQIGARPAAPAQASNVLFIVVDTLRADHLPGYGYAAGSTPNLEAFAGDAIRFDQAFANASWTRPSFASILTGRYPANHGTMSKAAILPGEVTTLAEAMKGAGYVTGGFVTNYNVAPYFNFQQGFDEYRYLEPNFVLGADDQAAKLLIIQSLRKGIETYRAKTGRVLPGTAYQDAATVNREVTAWLDRAPAKPWLLFAAYMDPHDPYFVHPYSGNGYARAAHPNPKLEEVPTLSKMYDGEITYWDGEFGKLVADLKRRGVYDDMTIVITSDHGEELGDHGGFWHGTTLYDEQVHVPLFVKLPKARRGGTVVRHWVEHVDILPTLLREAGIAVPKGVQGGDLFTGTDVVYGQESHEGNVLESVRERRGGAETKLITANQGNPRGLEPVELYRVDEDIAEKNNVAASDAEGVKAAMTTLVARAKAASTGAARVESIEMDAEAAARLRALGYAEEKKK
jgi:arylsulfatase A-like enzyme